MRMWLLAVFYKTIDASTVTACGEMNDLKTDISNTNINNLFLESFLRRFLFRHYEK